MDSPMLPEQTPNLPGRLWRRAGWWWRGRDWKTFRLAAPAVVIGLFVAILAGVCAIQSPRELQARYLAHGKSAFEAKDYPRAMTCYERVAPTAEPDALYRLALAADATGDRGRAITLMRGLAPDDPEKVGYAPAHLWWARQVLALSTATPALAVAAFHLDRALAGDLGADRPAVQAQLGNLYLVGRVRLDDAERLLTQAAQTVREAHFDLAQLYRLRGNTTRARQEAELAARFFRERAKADPNNHAARLAWANATAFLEDFPSAATILEDGLAATNAPVYRVALAKLYAGWYDLRKNQAAPAGELLALLDKGLHYDPAGSELLNRLIDQLRVGGPDADKARATLRELLARGTAPAHVHFALAVDARLRADAAAEKLHLEMAFAADPKAGVVANNLAHVLAQPPHADLPRALATVNLALDREPNNPTYLDTRGRIYLALGRWKDAAVDLDAVLARAPNAEGVRAALATAYENLGQPALAAEYRRAAEAIGRKPPPKP
jgi:lipopolysaccharide biosynthesis regulator YciM